VYESRLENAGQSADVAATHPAFMKFLVGCKAVSHSAVLITPLPIKAACGLGRARRKLHNTLIKTSVTIEYTIRNAYSCSTVSV
jgi:hypothetical protein